MYVKLGDVVGGGDGAMEENRSHGFRLQVAGMSRFGMLVYESS